MPKKILRVIWYKKEKTFENEGLSQKEVTKDILNNNNFVASEKLECKYQ